MLTKRIRSLEEGPGGKVHSTTAAMLPRCLPFLPSSRPAASDPSAQVPVRLTAAASSAGRSSSPCSGKPLVAIDVVGGLLALASQSAAPGDGGSTALATDRAVKLVNRMLSGGKVRRAHACSDNDP